MKLLNICMGGGFFLFISCDLFNIPIKPFFEENTSVSQISRHTINVETFLDCDNKQSIPSDKDCTITFDLSNPKEFTVNSSIQFKDQEVQAIYEQNKTNVKIEQIDETQLSLTINKDFLYATEHGKDLDATILLNEKETGRSFPSYELKNVRSNTCPPQVEDLTVMHAKIDSTDKYVLCFEMPMSDLQNPVHKDDCQELVIVTKNQYNNEEEKVYTFNSSAENVSELNFTKKQNDDEAFFTTTQPTGLTVSSPTGAEYTHTTRSVYYITDTYFTSNYEFRVFIRDKKGLKIESNVSVNTKQLKVPKMNTNGLSTSNTKTVNQNKDDGTFIVEVQLDSQTVNNEEISEGVSIYYDLDGIVEGKLCILNKRTLLEVDSNGKGQIKVPPGTWNLDIYQEHPNYFKSDTWSRHYPLNVTLATAWVDSTTIKEEQLGSKDYPIKSLTTVNFTSGISGKKVINVVSTEGEFHDIYYGGVNDCTIQGPNETPTEIKQIFKFHPTNIQNVTLKNLKLSGGIETGTRTNLILEDCSIDNFKLENGGTWTAKNLTILGDAYFAGGTLDYVKQTNKNTPDGTTLTFTAGTTVKVNNAEGGATVKGKIDVTGNGKVKLCPTDLTKPIFTCSKDSSATDFSMIENLDDKFILIDTNGNEIEDQCLYIIEINGDSNTKKIELRAGTRIKETSVKFHVVVTKISSYGDWIDVTIEAKDFYGNDIGASNIDGVSYKFSDDKNTTHEIKYGVTTQIVHADTDPNFVELTVKAFICGREYVDKPRLIKFPITNTNNLVELDYVDDE